MVNVVLSSGCVGPDIKNTLCYGLLLKHLKSSEIHWLHPDLTVAELTHRYEQQHLEAEWRWVPLSLCGHKVLVQIGYSLNNCLTFLFVAFQINISVMSVCPDMT